WEPQMARRPKWLINPEIYGVLRHTVQIDNALHLPDIALRFYGGFPTFSGLARRFPLTKNLKFIDVRQQARTNGSLSFDRPKAVLVRTSPDHFNRVNPI